MTKKNIYPPLTFLETAVDGLKKIDEQEERWQSTFDEMFDGSWCIPTYYDVPRQTIITMVEKAFDDIPNETTGSWFSWWVYETGYGTKKEFADSVTDVKTGKAIPMSTVKELYDYYISR